MYIYIYVYIYTYIVSCPSTLRKEWEGCIFWMKLLIFSHAIKKSLHCSNNSLGIVAESFLLLSLLVVNIWFQAMIRGEVFFSSFSFPVMIGDRIGFVGRREKSLWCQSKAHGKLSSEPGQDMFRWWWWWWWFGGW